MKILLEDTLEQKIDNITRGIDNIEVAQDNGRGDIEEELDEILEIAEEENAIGDKNWVNLLIIGEGGTGKTSRVMQWAEESGVHLFFKDAKTLDQTDLGGIPSVSDNGKRAVKLSTSELDMLDKPRSVLFLDEYNRAKKDIRGTLLTLINDHYIEDSSVEGGKRYFPNFLFTVAAINPPTPGYNVEELDAAELTRFEQMTVSQDPAKYRAYIIGHLKDKLRKATSEKKAQQIVGKIRLADKLLSSREFKFDSPEEVYEAQQLNLPALNYRSLTNLLQRCNGTKENFLNHWEKIVNPAKKEMAERILSTYEDKDDKANSVFKGDNRPDFMKGPSVWDKVKGNI